MAGSSATCGAGDTARHERRRYRIHDGGAVHSIDGGCPIPPYTSDDGEAARMPPGGVPGGLPPDRYRGTRHRVLSQGYCRGGRSMALLVAALRGLHPIDGLHGRHAYEICREEGPPYTAPFPCPSVCAHADLARLFGIAGLRTPPVAGNGHKRTDQARIVKLGKLQSRINASTPLTVGKGGARQYKWPGERPLTILF
jgi:hypothetical protein